MRTTFAATAATLLSLAAAQTFTDCDPTKKTCPPEPALGTTLTTDFRKGASSDWTLAEGTTLKYDPTNGAEFIIDGPGKAPTIQLNKFIFFGKLEVLMRASKGTGTVSSLVLESADLDEIDWEWLGSDHYNVQTNFFGKGNTTTYDRGGIHPIADPTENFHTYTIDWTTERLQWSIDGNVIRTVPYADPKALYGKNYPQTPMAIKMGSWIGCADKAAAESEKTKGTCEWAGGPIDHSGGPYIMHVKTVKVVDYGCAEEYVYGDLSGSWQSIKSVGGCKGGKSENPSGGSSGSSSSSTTSASSSKTTAGPKSSTSSPAILIETSVSLNSTASSTPTAIANNATSTLARVTSTSATTTSSSAAQVTGNAATSLSTKKYGILDAVVVAAGIGMGYLIM